jgi:hypothetical protein
MWQLCPFFIKKTKLSKNYGEKIKNVKNILSSWAYRDFTYIGRITVIKTLALPLLVQILTVLPNPPTQVMKEIQDMFYKHSRLVQENFGYPLKSMQNHLHID